MAERTVFIHLPGETEAVPAGRLTMIEQGLQVQASTFAYGRRYLARANALPVDPVSLALESGQNDQQRVPAAGLAVFGALRDAIAQVRGQIGVRPAGRQSRFVRAPVKCDRLPSAR